MNNKNILSKVLNPQPRKLYVKVRDLGDKKGLETFVDTQALEDFDDVKKAQLISIFISALEIIYGDKIIIQRMGDLIESQQEHDSRNSQTYPFMEENIQPPVQEMPVKSSPGRGRPKKSRDGSSNRQDENNNGQQPMPEMQS